MHATGCGLGLCASCRRVISGIGVKETVCFHHFSLCDENCENPFHSREQELVRQSSLSARKPGLSSISCLEEDTHHFKITMVYSDLSSVMWHRMALLSVFSRIRSA
mgnify:FL=1